MISRNHKAKANEVNFGAPNQIKANISNKVLLAMQFLKNN